MTDLAEIGAPSTDRIVLSAKGLQVETPTGAPIIDDVSFDLVKGEVLGIVGESGSGKTTAALAVLGMSHPGARLRAGTLLANGRTVEVVDAKAMSALRGRYVSYVPQSPGTALNPAMRVGTALREMLRRVPKSSGRPHSSLVIGAALEKVHLPRTREFMHRFPHQLSGGQQQRVCIAMTLLSGSQVIILDEPTTGLDVITQGSVIGELKQLRRELGLSMLYISHDLAVVSQLADRVAVMYFGSIVELGTVSDVLRSPAHPYTRGLLASTLDFRHPRELRPMPGAQIRSDIREQGCSFASRCSSVRDECRESLPSLSRRAGCGDTLVRCFYPAVGPLELFPEMTFPRLASDIRQPVLAAENIQIAYKLGAQVFTVVNDVSFEIKRGECLALLGESGSGKSTIARGVVGLRPISAGSVRLDGVELAPQASGRTAEQRRRVQMVFQNSSAALNPREDVRAAIERGSSFRGLGKPSQDRRTKELLELVRLPSAFQYRFPRELSGGERQRVCIARALASSPDILVCDEITSALDVSVQAAVLSLIKSLQRELHLTLLFITHDMGVVSYLANAVIVLNRGRICERGATTLVLNTPQADYARRLIRAVPSLETGSSGTEQVILV